VTSISICNTSFVMRHRRIEFSTLNELVFTKSFA